MAINKGAYILTYHIDGLTRLDTVQVLRDFRHILKNVDNYITIHLLKERKLYCAS